MCKAHRAQLFQYGSPFRGNKKPWHMKGTDDPVIDTIIPDWIMLGRPAGQQSMVDPGDDNLSNLAAYTEELGAWVAGKLAGFDGDEKVAASKGKKFGGREGYEAWLRGKVQEKLAAVRGDDSTCKAKAHP